MSFSVISILFLKTSKDGDPTTSLGSWFQCITILSESIFFLISNLTSVYLCIWKTIGNNRIYHSRRIHECVESFNLAGTQENPAAMNSISGTLLDQTQPVATALPLILCGHCCDHFNEVTPCCGDQMLYQGLGKI